MNLRPYFGDNAYHFVADSYSRDGTGHAAVLDMQITCADARQSDLHNGIFRFQYLRLRLLHQGEAALVYVCVCFHLSFAFEG